MSDDYGCREVIDDRLEMYLALDPEPLHEELLDEPLEEDDDIYAPVVGVQQIQDIRTGIQTVEEESWMLSFTSQPEPGNEDQGFCWGNDIVDALQRLGDWFDRESLYDPEERGSCVIQTYDAPTHLTVEETRGATIVMDYTTNTKTAENLSFRVRLVYGVPWKPVDEQHCAVTIITDHMPESVDECIAAIELAFRQDPVHGIPTCLFDDFDNGILTGGEPESE